jgi:hypothetical protein
MRTRYRFLLFAALKNVVFAYYIDSIFILNLLVITIMLGIRIRNWIRIRRVRMFLGLPDPDPLVGGTDPAPDPIEGTEIMPAK